MLLGQHCSWLSVTFKQYCLAWIRPQSGVTMPNNIVDNIEQCCPHNVCCILFSTASDFLPCITRAVMNKPGKPIQWNSREMRIWTTKMGDDQYFQYINTLSYFHIYKSHLQTKMYIDTKCKFKAIFKLVVKYSWLIPVNDTREFSHS